MNYSKRMDHNKKNNSDKKSKKTLELEKEVALGLWLQVLGQILELKGLSGLLKIKDDTDTMGEEQIITGVWIKTIGQILEAASVSSQIRETDLLKLLQEQKIALTGDLLVAIGSTYEVIGGIRVVEKETVKTTTIVP